MMLLIIIVYKIIIIQFPISTIYKCINYSIRQKDKHITIPNIYLYSVPVVRLY